MSPLIAQPAAPWREEGLEIISYTSAAHQHGCQPPVSSQYCWAPLEERSLSSPLPWPHPLMSWYLLQSTLATGRDHAAGRHIYWEERLYNVPLWLQLHIPLEIFYPQERRYWPLCSEWDHVIRVQYHMVSPVVFRADTVRKYMVVGSTSVADDL